MERSKDTSQSDARFVAEMAKMKDYPCRRDLTGSAVWKFGGCMARTHPIFKLRYRLDHGRRE